jgi:molybdate transport repressor ModE-like protein
MKQNLYLKLTVRLCADDGTRVFGPGVAALLRRVEAHHSLRSAAASMDMAYSKAWRIIRNAEAGLGCSLLTSTTGGKNGGGATLTPEAVRLLDAYEGLRDELESLARRRSDALLEASENMQK